MIALLVFSVLALGFSIYVFRAKLDVPTIPLLIAGLFFGFLILYVVMFEFRTKALKVRISQGLLFTKNFAGFGREIKYSLEDFEGYVTCSLRTKYNSYEYLFLVKGQKRIHVASEYYHINYQELKNAISHRLTFLRTERYSIVRAMRDVIE